MENNEEKNEVVSEQSSSNIPFNSNMYNGQSYNSYSNTTYSNMNNNQNNKLEKDIKSLKAIILLLFLVCIGLGVFTFVRPNIKSESKKKDDESNSNIELNYTQTTTPNIEGTYVTDVSDVVNNVMPSIVAITSKTLVNSGNYGPYYWGGSQKQYSTGAGSGIIVSKSDKELLILTNKHVIEGAEKLSVKFINNKSVDATVKGASSSKDVAIIAIQLSSIDSETLKEIKIATMGDSSKLKVGEGVVAIGNALGYGQSVTVGVISALNRQVTIDNITTNMIQTDAAINGGNSGGALLNSKGEVIGINSAKYSSNGSSSSASIEGMGFAIPITDVADLIKKLMNGEVLTETERGYLGVTGYMTTDVTDEDVPKGFYIKSIVKNSGADKGGLSIGNIITKIDNKDITQFSDISAILEDKKAGDKVELTIRYASGREYKEKKIKITLSSYEEVS